MSCSTAAALLLDEGTDIAVAEAVRAVCEASTWWVGVFATVRHLGVHHTTLTPVTEEPLTSSLRQ